MLLTNKPSKLCWKLKCKKAINDHWSKTLTDSAKTKTTLSLLGTEPLKTGQAHHVWRALDFTVSDVTKGITKARLVTGTYLFQTNKHRFSQYTVDPTCPNCHLEPEDAIHMLLRCPALHEIRKEFYPKFHEEITNELGPVTSKSITKVDITQLIIDCSGFKNII